MFVLSEGETNEKKKSNPNNNMIYKELLEVKGEISTLNEGYIWLKKQMKSVSDRQWFIVVGIIIAVLIQIWFSLKG